MLDFLQHPKHFHWKFRLCRASVGKGYLSQQLNATSKLLLVTEGQTPRMKKANLQTWQRELTSGHLYSALMKAEFSHPSNSLSFSISAFLQIQCICCNWQSIQTPCATHPLAQMGEAIHHVTKTGSMGSHIPTTSMLHLGSGTEQRFLCSGCLCGLVMKKAECSP